jgi:hypothetical protein
MESAMNIRKNQILIILTGFTLIVLLRIIPLEYWLFTWAFNAVVLYYAFNRIINGLERARERARIHSRLSIGLLETTDLPERAVAFPFGLIVAGLFSLVSPAVLAEIIRGFPRILSGPAIPALPLAIIAIIFAFIGCGIMLYAFVEMIFWIIIQSGETAFTAAEALRRRKLKETIYAEADGEPLNVSDWRGDVSVGDDGELLDQPRQKADGS